MSRTKRLHAARFSRDSICRSGTWSTTPRRTFRLPSSWHDLSLYLDTHAGDAEAFGAYQDLLRLAEEGAQRYAKLYGPITKRDLLNAETYTWLKSPWPWEYRGGTEG